MIKTGLEPLSRPRILDCEQWRKDWVKIYSDLAQGRPAWDASTRDVANSFGDAGSIRPGVNAAKSKKLSTIIIHNRKK